MLFNNKHKSRKSPERYISCRVIIDKIYRDLDFDETNDRWQDMVEWMAEAIEFIHISYTLEKKVVTLTVSNYRAELPCDFYSLIMFKPYDMASRESQNPFDYSDNHPKSVRSHYIEYPYLKTSLQEGEADMAYWAFPIDEENFPKIPDNVYIKEALFWYVIKKLIMGGYRHPDPTFSFMFCDDKWKEYCHKAKSYYRMPDLSEMESLKANWTRLVPKINSFNNGFANYNSQERWQI